MPEIPDVAILHCGEMLHHKMGIKVILSSTSCPMPLFNAHPFLLQLNTFNNIEEGTVGRILSYYDLSDRKQCIMEKDDLDFTEFLDEEEQARIELEDKLKKEEQERKEEEELRKALADIERRRKAEEEEAEKSRQLSMSKEQRQREEERGSKDPVSSEEIFRNVNKRRESLARAKKAGPAGGSSSAPGILSGTIKY